MLAMKGMLLRSMMTMMMVSRQFSCKVGLLKNTMGDVTKQNSFARNLTLEDARAMFDSGNLVYSSLEAGLHQTSTDPADYLFELLRNIDQDFQKNQPYGRLRFMKTMQDLVKQRGKFITVIGPANSGKSFVMEMIKQRNPSSTILVDLRGYQGDITTALLAHVTSSSWSRIITSIMGALTSLLKSFNLTIPFAAPLSLNAKDLTEKLEANKMSSVGIAVRGLTERFSSADRPLTFIIDDADLAFDNEYGNLEDRSACTLLDLFVYITKKSNKANVFLVTNQLSFPFNLSKRINFNASYFTSILYIGELLPEEIWNVMVMRWGVAPQLAEALISYYGGDLWSIYNALQLLKADLDHFNPRSIWGHTLEDDILDCYEWKDGAPEERLRMQAILVKLCEDGFAPLQRLNDPVALYLSKKFIGGVIKNTTNMVGLSEEVWKANAGCDYGIIPSKQWIRLAIGYVLASRHRKTQEDKVKENSTTYPKAMN